MSRLCKLLNSVVLCAKISEMFLPFTSGSFVQQIGCHFDFLVSKLLFSFS